MQRVMIVGGPGSGKSTLARQLGEKTGLPVYHMDRIHWQPGWIERETDEKARLTREVHARQRWIFEGGFSDTYRDRAARADTLIWLDIAMWRRMVRVIRRMIVNRGKSRPDMPDGCPERLDREFLEFLRFICRTRRSGPARIRNVVEAGFTHLRVHRLTSLRDVRQFLASLD
ncbi:MAG: DNA topology modulation protein FlaR [Pseudomonadota bacterium]